MADSLDDSIFSDEIVLEEIKEEEEVTWTLMEEVDRNKVKKLPIIGEFEINIAQALVAYEIGTAQKTKIVNLTSKLRSII